MKEEITGMDQFLWDRYEQLKAIHERLIDCIRHSHNWEWRRHVGEKMVALVDDLERMRDDAKAEFDSF